MEQQLRFDLSVRPALGREDFFVSPANALALALLDGWREWPGGKFILIGAEGSGKTHLAHVWATETGARIVNATDLPEAKVGELAQGAICVEDAQSIAGNADAEAHLFHLHNLVLAEGHPLLVTATTEAAHWGLDLPDLASRMQGTQAARLDPPDDDLLGAVLTKLFADRQLYPNPDVIPYLVRHGPRSFADARAVVEWMDDHVLGTRKPLSRDLARRALEDLAPVHSQG